LYRGTGELCGNVFWSFFNERFHCLYPDSEKYVAEIEKSIYNVLLANQDAGTGIRYGANLVGKRAAGDHTNTCCEGQGTRMLGALPQFIYSTAGDDIYVNLFTASSITGRSLTLQMKTQFPYDGAVEILVNNEQPSASTIFLRIPSWAAAKMPIIINGKQIAQGKPGSYIALKRVWKKGDQISFVLPMNFTLTKYKGVDVKENAERYALEYGPLLLACTDVQSTGREVYLTGATKQMLKKLKPVPGKPLHYTLPGYPNIEYLPYFEVSKGITFSCFPYLTKAESTN
jgi:DUF1680 family protein